MDKILNKDMISIIPKNLFAAAIFAAFIFLPHVNALAQLDDAERQDLAQREKLEVEYVAESSPGPVSDYDLTLSKEKDRAAMMQEEARDVTEGANYWY